MMMSACGIYKCEECNYRRAGNCPGCGAGNSYPQVEVEERCAVYDCVTQRGAASCGECGESGCVLKQRVESICPMRSRFEKKRWWAGKIARALESRRQIQQFSDEDGKASAKVINRLRWYLKALDIFTDEGAASVSSWQLAERVGVNSALIRKDLSRFGEFGTPSFGYKVDYLTQRIRCILHLDQPKKIVWIGSSCFRLHTGSVEKMKRHGCGVVGVFDMCPDEIGAKIGEHTVMPIEQLPDVVLETGAVAAALAISGPAAHNIAEMLVDLGVKAILNVGGELLVLPENIRLYSFDIAGEILELCFYC